MVSALPKKLKHDAIVEALLEIQFDSNEQSEIIIGRLSDSDLWSGYSTTRLSPANLPESIREVDENLKYQPILERRSQNDVDCVRIGSHVLSYHTYAPYLGWAEFQLKLSAVTNLLFDKVPSAIVKRLGFRYVNFLLSDQHKISNLSELALSLTLKEDHIMEGVNLTLSKTLSESHQSLSKVASSDFLAMAVVPENIVCAVDIDIFTPVGYSANTANEVSSWVEEAHIYEKTAFFSFLTQDTINILKEE